MTLPECRHPLLISLSAALVLLASAAEADRKVEDNSMGSAETPLIIDRPIRFDQERVQLTLDYIRRHYDVKTDSIQIVPRVLVVHWTGTPQLEGIWRAFNRVRMRSTRRYLLRGGKVNVSAHFLVDRDGTIYRLMPETWMARHCIGLNYDAIGIENVGDGSRFPLTDKQLSANAALIRYLVAKHPIGFLIGHHEWKRLEHSPFFRERNPTYRNSKDDPGEAFMRRLRAELKGLGLADSYPPSKRNDPLHLRR